jgi:CRISPR type III-A/MTUBE-associated protein Csm6
MKKLLFSPVGGNDPISNFRDGSLLHICRFYRPDVIYLYMSKEIFVYHEQDDRYRLAIGKLAEELDWCPAVEIVPDSFSEVHEYDYYYKKFSDCLNEITNQNSEGLNTKSTQLYVNVSSGTPAMKTALQVLSMLSAYRTIPLQVATPIKGMNPTVENRSRYEFEEQWDCNEDNEKSAENRCKEVRSENLLTLMKIDLIKSFIRKYDYVAAFEVAQTIRPQIEPEALILLEAQKKRLKLDLSGADKLLKHSNRYRLPQISGDHKNIFEYLLWLKVKLEKEEYADFLRGLSPAITEIFTKILEHNGNLEDYYTFDKRKKRYVLSGEKIECKKKVSEAFHERYGEGIISEKDLSSDNLVVIIMSLHPEKDVRKKIEGIRNFEYKLRNKAAHEIVSATEDWMKQTIGGGKSGKAISQGIWDDLKYLLSKSGAKIDEKYWQSYEEANRLIDDSLSKIIG